MASARSFGSKAGTTMMRRVMKALPGRPPQLCSRQLQSERAHRSRRPAEAQPPRAAEVWALPARQVQGAAAAERGRHHGIATSPVGALPPRREAKAQVAQLRHPPASSPVYHRERSSGRQVGALLPRRARERALHLRRQTFGRRVALRLRATALRRRGPPQAPRRSPTQTSPPPLQT